MEVELLIMIEHGIKNVCRLLGRSVTSACDSQSCFDELGMPNKT